MERHFKGITERMLQSAKSLNEKINLAKQLGIEITKDNISMPDALFKIFKPKVLGKFIGGLFLVAAGDLVYKILAKKVMEKYPQHQDKTSKVLFVIKHIDLLLSPSWLKVGTFAAGNLKDFKRGFDAGYGRASKFGQYLVTEMKEMISGKTKTKDRQDKPKNN
ncbi:MAG: hypothetical protein Q7K65_03785 [Candidatus Buchananbacteria bacterium]|nr:hypothetical protein [Candidatus Buchananbacteria bacterium]